MGQLIHDMLIDHVHVTQGPLALESSYEGLSHINAQVTDLFFVAMPCYNFSFDDFIEFAAIDPLAKKHLMCVKFGSIETAQQCFLRCYARYFDNTGADLLCHVLSRSRPAAGR